MSSGVLWGTFGRGNVIRVKWLPSSYIVMRRGVLAQMPDNSYGAAIVSSVSVLNDICAGLVTSQLDAEHLVGIESGFLSPKGDEFANLAHTIEAAGEQSVRACYP